ncbi:MAG: ROK family protein [Alphaproteobacteria bacterium]|nr:ROK family protein [Alphaproteobacteria bacterium]MCL2505689.1 ROK family protein [Alphaproteobacteria bacterium]
MFYIGIDIGGTKCRVSLAKETTGGLEFIAFGERHVTADYSPDEMLETLLADVNELTKKAGEKPAAIGISCGSPMDQKQGLILSPPHLPGWDNIPIVAFFQDALGIPTFLENDANAGALAEWKYGAGKGANHVIFITAGTGFGAGLILNGKLYTGATGMAGEIGHVRWAFSGNKYPGYGKESSIEGGCSGTGIAEIAKGMIRDELEKGRCLPAWADIEKLTAESVGAAAERGDPLALKIYAQVGKNWGHSVSMLIDVFSPELIVMGSIFVRRRNELLPHMERVIREETLAITRNVCRVVPAVLGEEIGNYAAITVGIYGLEQSGAN